VFEFSDGCEVIIGRGEDCGLRITDVRSSRRHARIGWAGDKAFLEDLHSKNGTELNGRPVRKAPLNSNDQIQIGNTVLTVTGLPQSAAVTTMLGMHDGPADVLVAMKQAEADMLANPTQPGAAPERPDLLQEICRISQAAAASRDTDQTVIQVLNDIRTLLSADTACLLMWDPSNDNWRVVAAAGQAESGGPLVVSRTIISQALREGQAILSADPLTDKRFDPSQSIVTQRITSAVCAPIRIGTTFGGVLSLDRRGRTGPFVPSDLRVAATVAGILSLLLERERAAIEARNPASQ